MHSRDAAIRCSTWLGVLMALIRFLALRFVSRPSFQKISQISFGFHATATCCVVSSIMSFVNSMRTKIIEIGVWKPGESCLQKPLETFMLHELRVSDAFSANNGIILRIVTFVNGISSRIFPCIILPILTILLILEIRRTRVKMTSFSSFSVRKRTERTTGLVILMAVTFFVASLPAGIFTLFQVIYTDIGFVFLAYPVENAHSGSKIEAGQPNSQILDPMDFSDTNFSPREQYLIDTALAEREKCEGLEKKVEEQQEYIKFLQEKAEELKKKEMKTKNEMVKYRDQGNVARNIAKEAKKRVFELEKEVEDRFNQQNGKFMMFDHSGRMDAYLKRINEKIKKVQLENEYVMNVIRVMSSCNEQTEQWNLYQGRMIEDLQEELQKKEEELKTATSRITEVQNQKMQALKLQKKQIESEKRNLDAEITHITLERQKVAHERCQSE
ncbi:hypothetical protein L5515_007171 [Caenorhabditis briggsae]|uniref:G-protein coupled receptors family 1 profile domain-containing protein n=1 Tax=Caenorhabditis briggsae TaxID=6238 RepID=A0AAE9EXQ4_CAEBR|nr:hypothetical protein L5515_007171 [Caenorhabditis briggsae]